MMMVPSSSSTRRASSSSSPSSSSSSSSSFPSLALVFFYVVYTILCLFPPSCVAWSSSFLPSRQTRRSPSTSFPPSSSSSSSLQMKIQWDPYTGQFLDLGDDVEEIGVPSRNPSSSSSSSSPTTTTPSGECEQGSKATGVKTEDLQVVGGNIGKANAYIAQKLMEASIEEGTGIVDALMKELDDLDLAEGEENTWPKITENMQSVLRNEEAAAYETVCRNVDLTRATTVLVYLRESAMAPALKECLKARGGSSREVVLGGGGGGGAAAAAAAAAAAVDVKGASVLVLLPDTKGGGSVMEAPAVEALIAAAAEGGGLRHVVYLSSLGSEKALFQFSFDSMSGVLEKKKAVEQSIKRLSKSLGYNFSIIRVGSLGPVKSGEEALNLSPGDPFNGGATNYATAAQAVVQSIALPMALNASFSVINGKGTSPPTDAGWRDSMLKLVGPEVLRLSFKETDVLGMRMSLRAWALQYMEGERRLTTKVFAVRTPLGAKIYFLPTMQSLGPGFREEKAIEKARMKGEAILGGQKPTRPILEGGLEVCVEEVTEAGKEGDKRVRVRRIAMEEGTVVKAMSERELLDSLKAEIESTEKSAKSGRRVGGGTPPV